MDHTAAMAQASTQMMVVLSAQQCYRTCASVIRPNTVALLKVSRGEIEEREVVVMEKNSQHSRCRCFSPTKEEPTPCLCRTISAVYSHSNFLLGSGCFSPIQRTTLISTTRSILEFAYQIIKSKHRQFAAYQQEIDVVSQVVVPTQQGEMLRCLDSPWPFIHSFLTCGRCEWSRCGMPSDVQSELNDSLNLLRQLTWQSDRRWEVSPGKSNENQAFAKPLAKLGCARAVMESLPRHPEKGQGMTACQICQRKMKEYESFRLMSFPVILAFVEPSRH